MYRGPSFEAYHSRRRWSSEGLATLGTGAWIGKRGELGTISFELRPHEGPRFEWRSLDGKHWQVVTSSSEFPETTDARERTSAGCRPGMVRVKGNLRVERQGEMTGEIERIQDGACTEWISRDFPARCQSFDRAKISSATSSSVSPTRCAVRMNATRRNVARG